MKICINENNLISIIIYVLKWNWLDLINISMNIICCNANGTRWKTDNNDNGFYNELSNCTIQLQKDANKINVCSSTVIIVNKSNYGLIFASFFLCCRNESNSNKWILNEFN